MSAGIFPLSRDHIYSKDILCYFFCHTGTCPLRVSQFWEGKKAHRVLVPISLLFLFIWQDESVAALNNLKHFENSKPLAGT